MVEGRKHLGVSLLAAALVALGFACGTADADAPLLDEVVANDGGAAADVGTPSSTGQVRTGLPCAVDEILRESCQTCHGSTPQAGASTSLVTWDDLQKDHGGKKLYEVVGDRIHAESQPMPPATRLSADQLKTVDDWIAAGAPKSDATCDAGDGPPPATRPFECPAPAELRVLKAATPFKWTQSNTTDQYMCFGVDEVVDTKRHVIAFGPKVDNLDIVHHILLFQTTTAMSNEPKPCSAIASANWKLVTGWAPGGGNFELPPEAGVPEEGTAHWVLQVHYNNASGKFDGATDDSGYQLCSTDQLRPNDAGILGFGSVSFKIPPRTAKHRIKCDYRLGAQFQGKTFFRAWPHMHTSGLAIATERLVGGKEAAAEPMFSQDPFSFENQESFPISTKVAIGDILRTRCTWKNTTDATISFGEETGDEMCFDFLSYYPAIPNMPWVTPSLFASCKDDSD